MLSRAFMRNRSGVAALEFALMAPFAIIMVIGIFDIARAFIVRQEVYNAAHLIPVSASSLAVQPDASTALTIVQVQQTLSGIFAEMPWLRSGGLTGLKSVTMTSVTFTQTNPLCVSSANNVCQFAPHTAWSVAYKGPPSGSSVVFAQVVRPCMQLNQTAPGQTTAGDLTSLPTANIVNPDPIIVVDVHYQFVPLFTKFITGNIDFWSSGFWPVRSVNPNAAVGQQYTKYDVNNLGGALSKCLGYS